jgi:hypothetical protein
VQECAPAAKTDNGEVIFLTGICRGGPYAYFIYIKIKDMYILQGHRTKAKDQKLQEITQLQIYSFT